MRTMILQNSLLNLGHSAEWRQIIEVDVLAGRRLRGYLLQDFLPIFWEYCLH